MIKKEKINKQILEKLLLIIFSALIGGLVMFLLIKYTTISELLLDKKEMVITKNKTKIYEKNSLAGAVEKIYDATVLIQDYDNGSLSSNGTGFIYKVDDKYGYILTNEHVLKGSEAKVVMSSDTEVDAKVLGKDEYLDLAVLRIDKGYVTLVANIASSENMNLGDTVFTVGSPLGYNYRGSVTSGVLSGKDRMVSISVTNTNNNDWVMRVLQIDASINPGNSGGPLLNANGEVIGICSMKLVDDNIEGMGFAIPIEYAMTHVEDLENGKKIKWPVLGIGMINVTDTTNLIKNDLNISSDLKEGIVVHSIKENSSAAKSKLKQGDIIIAINGTKVKDIAYLKYELYKYNAEDIIEITYLRDNKERKTKVKLGGSE